MILTVWVYVSPTGTSTKLTVFGVTSIKGETGAAGSGFAVPLGALWPLAWTANNIKLDKISDDLRKLLKFRHLQKYIPTMPVPPSTACRLTKWVDSYPTRFLEATGREFTGGTG